MNINLAVAIISGIASLVCFFIKGNMLAGCWAMCTCIAHLELAESKQ